MQGRAHAAQAALRDLDIDADQRQRIGLPLQQRQRDRADGRQSDAGGDEKPVILTGFRLLLRRGQPCESRDQDEPGAQDGGQDGDRDSGENGVVLAKTRDHQLQTLNNSL
jgi:hypothetical protein